MPQDAEFRVLTMFTGMQKKLAKLDGRLKRNSM
jgi:hypothetical protein